MRKESEIRETLKHYENEKERLWSVLFDSNFTEEEKQSAAKARKNIEQQIELLKWIVS